MRLVAFRKRLTEATLRGGAYETLFAALLAALTVFTLTGCGKIENPAEPVTPGQAEEPATPTEPELTPEEIAEQERLAAEKAREERLQGLLDSMTLEEKVGTAFLRPGARRPTPWRIFPPTI